MEKITMYSTPTCQRCKILKGAMKNRGIAFEENQDIPLMKSKGISSVPVLEVQGKLYNYDEAVKFINEFE